MSEKFLVLRFIFVKVNRENSMKAGIFRRLSVCAALKKSSRQKQFVIALDCLDAMHFLKNGKHKIDHVYSPPACFYTLTFNNDSINVEKGFVLLN